MNKNITKSKHISMTDEMLDQVSGGTGTYSGAIGPDGTVLGETYDYSGQSCGGAIGLNGVVSEESTSDGSGSSTETIDVNLNIDGLPDYLKSLSSK